MPNAARRKRAPRREERVSRTYRLPLSKLRAAKRALGAATATETIERALDLAVFQRANRTITPSADAWQRSGDLLAEMARQEGLEVARVSKAFANDVLLALSCREAGCVLVTDNERDFQRIRHFVPFDFIKPWPGGISTITLPSGS